MDRETQLPDQTAPQSDVRGTNGDILPALLRYRDRNGWSWNLSMRLINMYYGTSYTEKQLKALYKACGAKN